MAQKVLEQLVLTPGQLQLDACAGHFPGEQVHLQIVGPQDQLRGREVAAEQGTEAGEKLGEGERLDQVVVRPAVQTLDPFLDRIQGREDQDRFGEAARPQFAEDVQSVPAGKHEVQHDRIDGPRRRGLEALDAGGSRDDLVALGLQAAPEAIPVLLLILDDQYPRHTATRPRRLGVQDGAAARRPTKAR